MKLKLYLIGTLFLYQIVNAQFGQILSIGKGINNNVSKKQKIKLFAEYLSKEFVKNDSLISLRVPENKIKSVVKKQIIEVQNLLEFAKMNFNKVDSEVYNLNEIDELIAIIENNDKNWNTKFYRNEYKIFFKDNYFVQEKLNQIKNNNNLSIRKNQQKIQDSITLIATLKEKPYKLLENHLLSISNHRYFTFFNGLDISFVSPYLSNYLQEYMFLSTKDFVSTPNKVTEMYIPKSSSGKDYLNVNYYVKKTNNKPYIQTDDGKCNEITKCEIIGTSDLVVNLFLKYWPQTMEIGGYKLGEIAHFQSLGDRVSIYGISPNVYKIVIIPDNVRIDYYEAYQIK